QILRSANFSADEGGGKFGVIPPVIFKIEIVLSHTGNVAEYSTGWKFRPVRTICQDWQIPSAEDGGLFNLVITQLFLRGPHWHFPAAERLLILAVCFSARIDRAFNSQSRQRRLNCCDLRRCLNRRSRDWEILRRATRALKRTAKINSRSAAE